MSTYLHLLYQLPAIVAATTMAAYLSPWKIAPRFAPALMFTVALLVLRAPEWIGMSLCLTIPAAWLQAVLGIDLHGHEALRFTLPAIRKPRFEMRRFADRAYPDPESAAPGPLETPEGGTHPEPATRVRTIRKFVPPL